jgi:hypothetical protein
MDDLDDLYEDGNVPPPEESTEKKEDAASKASSTEEVKKEEPEVKPEETPKPVETEDVAKEVASKEGEGITPPKEGEGEGKEGLAKEEHKDGVGAYLESFGIKDQMIDFEDGESKHFSELDPESQLNVLNTLADKKAKMIEDKHELSDQEIVLLNTFREEGSDDLDSLLNKIADEKVRLLKEGEFIGDVIDYENMEADVLFKNYLKESFPDSSEEELNEDLATAKEQKTYDASVKAIREAKTRTQEVEIEGKREERRKAIGEENEVKKKEIVQSVQEVTELDGWPVTDEIKNKTLGELVEFDEYGKSPLMKKLEDPETAFRAAWLLDNAKPLFEQMDNYYKSKVDEAYEKGKNEKRRTTPDEGVVVEKKDSESAGETNKNPIGDNDKVTTMDDLYGN